MPLLSFQQPHLRFSLMLLGAGRGGSSSSSSGCTVFTTTFAITPHPVPLYTNLEGGVVHSSQPCPRQYYPPIDPCAQASKCSKKFVWSTPLAGAHLNEIKLLVTKYERKASGLKQMFYFQQLATELIEHKQGVASHFIVDRDNAEDRIKLSSADSTAVCQELFNIKALPSIQ